MASSSSILQGLLTRYTERKVWFLTLVESGAEICASTVGRRRLRTEHAGHSASGTSYSWLSPRFVTTPRTLMLHHPRANATAR